MKRIILFISLILLAFAINAQSVTANQLNGRLSISAASNVSDSTWSITGTFSNSVNKYVPSQIAVNDKLFVQIGANTYVGRISVINSYSDVTRLITFRVICNYPNPPNSGSTIAAIVRATSNGYPVWVDGIPNALQAGIQNYFATLVNTNAAGSPCEQTITQSAHAFRKFTPVKWNSNTSRYERSTNDTIVPDYIVVDSLTANTFKVATCGTYTTTLTNGLYWFTSASPGYSLTQDTTKVPLFQVLNGKLILNPIVGFNLMSGSGDVTSSVLADTAAAIRADFPDLSLRSIYETIPAIGLAANESVANYNFASVNGSTYKFSTIPLGSPSTEYGGWLANGTSGDSIRVSAPFWVVIGDSQAEGHPATHGRLHSPVNLTKADVTGQLSYHLRQLTKYRWFNQGIGGQTSTQVLNRFDRDALGRTYDAGDGLPTKTLSGKPMGVVIIVGINDLYNGITVATVKSNLTQMAIKCQLEGIYCVMLNIPGDEVINETQSKQVDEINQWLKNGALNMYNVAVVDYNTWWRDPTYNDNAHAGSLIVDDIHPSAVGYDSLANYIFREANLPVLTQVIVSNELSPSTPITGFSRPNSIKVGGTTTYSLSAAVDTFAVTAPITTDSVWIRILASTNVSGTSYSGFSHIQWVLDNGVEGIEFEKNGSNINDLLYPYITVDPVNNSTQPILYNRPVQRNYTGYFGTPFFTVENVAAGTSPVSHTGRGGFLIQMPEGLDGFFGIMELEFSGANSIPLSGINIAFQNHFYSVEYTGYFAQNRPYFKLVGDQVAPSGRDFYIVVGDSTLTWSYTICRVKHITSFGGFVTPDYFKNTQVTFTTTPRIFVASKPHNLPLGFGLEYPTIERSNTVTSTTDGSGDITVGIVGGAMPDASYVAICQPEGNSTSVTWQVHTKTTTSFKIRIRDSNTKAALTATSVTFTYLIRDY